MRTAFAALITLAASPAASEFILEQPVDCVLGDSCFIQNYVDHDGGSGAQDYRCGALVYDGHKGTDFALPTLADMQAGVNVLAAVSGTVLGIRDGMEDTVFSSEPAASVQGRECGNGVVIASPDGWETQYCHLKKGSVQVKTGDSVSAGTVLGQIGLSGKTQFPHLHLSVRKNSIPVDPFAPDGPQACASPQTTLWADPMTYAPGGLISAGFTSDIPKYSAIKAGTAAQEVFSVKAGAIVLFGYAFGIQKNDIMRIEIFGPQGQVSSDDIVFEKDQAQAFRATGRRLSQPQWPAGTYRGEITLIRDDAAISARSVTVPVR